VGRGAIERPRGPLFPSQGTATPEMLQQQLCWGLLGDAHHIFKRQDDA